MNHEQSAQFAASQSLAAQQFKTRIKSAITKSAVDIHTESEETALHEERMAWVRLSLRDAGAMAERMALGVLLNLAPADEDAVAQLTDVQLNNSVAALINAYAL
jgi:hypothetical protein